MKVKTSTLLIFLTALSAVSAGCGYTMKDQYHAGVNTVFVPVWTRGKDVYRRELEMRLTEAIQKRIEQDTPYKVVAKTRAKYVEAYERLTGRRFEHRRRGVAEEGAG